MFDKSKAMKSIENAHHARQYTHVLKVTGYSEYPDNPLLFIQPEKYVYGAGGVKADAILMRSYNPAFIDMYGDTFFVVGKNFAGMSNKEQLATLQAEAARSSFTVSLRFGLDGHYVMAQIAPTRADQVVMVQGYGNVAAMSEVAGVFGAHMGRKIGGRMMRRERAAARHDAALAAEKLKAAVKDGSVLGYSRNKPGERAYKAGNKQAMRAAKTALRGAPPCGPLQPMMGVDPLEAEASKLQHEPQPQPEIPSNDVVVEMPGPGAAPDPA